MKFAIVGSRGFPSSYGGFETLVRRLAPYLASRGHEVLVYGRQASEPTLEQVPPGVTVKVTHGLNLKSASTLTHGFTAVRDVRHQHVDAALILNVANGFFLPRFKRMKIPTCVNVDGIEWERGKWGKLAQGVFLRGAKITAKLADSLIFDSREIASIWMEQFGRSGNFIPYGAEVLTDVDSDKILDLGIQPKTYLLVVARIIPENNVELLLDALELLSSVVKVVIVGDGNYRHPTLERLRSSRERGEIVWLGHVHDQQLLNQLWANALVYWHGHSVGGTNPALLQALGAGAPVIALDTRFNREVIGDERQLVKHSSTELAETLDKFLGDELLRIEVSQIGQDKVRTRYSWPSVCNSYATLLESLVDEK